MKTNRRLRFLLRSGVLQTVIGLTCIIGGISIISSARDMCRTYTDGNWSVRRVTQRLGIERSEDLKTENERNLLTFVTNTNRQCQELSNLNVLLAIVIMLIGAGSFATAINLFAGFRRLRKDVAEQLTPSDSVPAAHE
jgi:hypothetical protein